MVAIGNHTDSQKFTSRVELDGEPYAADVKSFSEEVSGGSQEKMELV